MRDKCSMRFRLISAFLAAVVYLLGAGENGACENDVSANGFTARDVQRQNDLTQGTGSESAGNEPGTKSVIKTEHVRGMNNVLETENILETENVVQSAGGNNEHRLEPQSAQLDETQPIYKYTGNLFSKKFHRPSCPFARAMWRQNVIRFQHRKQAVDAGQKPCRYCLPPTWKSVGARILKAPPAQEIEGAKGLSTVENENDLPTVTTESRQDRTDAGFQPAAQH